MTTLATAPDFTAYEKAAEAADNLDPAALADTIISLQDVIAHLRGLELDLAAALGRRQGPHTGNASDGRQFTLKRTPDRKEWDHDDWKRDVRRRIVETVMDGGPLSVLNEETGNTQPLAPLLHAVLADAQDFHGSTAPRSTALRSVGLYASDYCTSSPGGWRFSSIRTDPAQGAQS